MKQLSTLLAILSLAAISFAFATTTSTAKSQRNTGDAVTASAQSSLQAQTVTSERYEVSSSGWTDAHADACAYNRDVCLKGCNGATSCSNQCWTNYNNCMKQ
jgi:hypothetical protein